MKTSVKIILSFLLFCTTQIQAQKFNGGVYAMSVFSQIDGDLYSGYHHLGFGGGGYVNRFISKKIALQMAIRYIQKGSSKKADDFSYQCTLQYIEIPFSLRYFYWKKIDIEAGISAGYLIKANEKKDGYKIIDAPPFNKFEWSGIIGLNYSLSEKISFGSQFMYSLFFIRPHSQNYNTMKSGQFNHLILLSVAYKFSDYKK